MHERLKELRKKLGLKQREIAKRLGVSVGNVGAWEIGAVPIPRARLYQICKEYNVRREWLENGDGDMFEDFDALFGDKIKNVSNQLLMIESIRRIYNEIPPKCKENALEFLKGLVDFQEGRRADLPLNFRALYDMIADDDPKK